MGDIVKIISIFLKLFWISCTQGALATEKWVVVTSVDGSWATWSSWSHCSVTCGTQQEVRHRLCNDPTPQFGGKGCQGKAVEVQDCNLIPCPVCSSHITIVSSDPISNDRNVAHSALTDGPCDAVEPASENRNYLVAPNGVSNFEFVVGFGCQEMVTKAQIRNTHNSYVNNKGTKEFSLAISDNNVNFTTVVLGSLPDARNKACGPDIPLLEFDINKEATYVKVTLISYYGRSAGLQYINFIFA